MPLEYEKEFYYPWVQEDTDEGLDSVENRDDMKGEYQPPKEI